MQQPWFVAYIFVPDTYPPIPSYENTSLVLFSFYTFIIGAMVFSHSQPFRKGILSNRILTAYMVLATVAVVAMTFITGDNFNKVLNFKPIPDTQFRWVLLLGAAVNLLVSMIWERFVLYGFIKRVVMPWAESVLPVQLPFQKLEKEYAVDRSWPPVTDLTSQAVPGDDASGDYSDDDEGASHAFMMRKLSVQIA